jgi:hypothetical protein
MTRIELHHLWQQRLNDFENSEQNGKEWCASQGISLSQFRYWRRKLLLTPATSPTHSWMTVDFEQAQEQETLFVHLGTSKIEVHAGFNPDLLANVVRVLRAL